MPDGINYTIKNINRKLSLVKIVCNQRGRDIIDDILENDIPQLSKEIKYEQREKD